MMMLTQNVVGTNKEFLGGKTMNGLDLDQRLIMQQRIKEKNELLTKLYIKDYAHWCNLRLRIQRIESKSHPSSRIILQKLKKESYVLGAYIYQKYYHYLPLIRQVECDSVIGDSIFTRTISNHIFK